MKSKKFLYSTGLSFCLVSLALSAPSFAGGKSKNKAEHKAAKEAFYAQNAQFTKHQEIIQQAQDMKLVPADDVPTYDKHLMPQALDGYTFSSDILIDVRREAMERTD